MDLAKVAAAILSPVFLSHPNRVFRESPWPCGPPKRMEDAMQPVWGQGFGPASELPLGANFTRRR